MLCKISAATGRTLCVAGRSIHRSRRTLERGRFPRSFPTPSRGPDAAPVLARAPGRPTRDRSEQFPKAFTFAPTCRCRRFSGPSRLASDTLFSRHRLSRADTSLTSKGSPETTPGGPLIRPVNPSPRRWWERSYKQPRVLSLLLLGWLLSAGLSVVPLTRATAGDPVWIPAGSPDRCQAP